MTLLTVSILTGIAVALCIYGAFYDKKENRKGVKK
jgi:hypothetical protein